MNADLGHPRRTAARLRGTRRSYGMLDRAAATGETAQVRFELARALMASGAVRARLVRVLARGRRAPLRRGPPPAALHQRAGGRHRARRGPGPPGLRSRRHRGGGVMIDTAAIDTDRLMGLWADPPADDDAALAAIRALYTDPVQINGTTMTALDLLARVRGMQRAYSGLRHELVERVDAPGRLVIAFRLRGTHSRPARHAVRRAGRDRPLVRGPGDRHPDPDRRPDQRRHDGGRRAGPARRARCPPPGLTRTRLP